MGAVPQSRKIIGINLYRGRRFDTSQQQSAQPLAILIPSNQFPNVLAAGAIPSLTHLIVDEGLEGVRQGNIHRAHGHIVGCLAKFGENGKPQRIRRPGHRPITEFRKEGWSDLQP